jgi:hypothetical protein
VSRTARELFFHPIFATLTSRCPPCIRRMHSFVSAFPKPDPESGVLVQLGCDFCTSWTHDGCDAMATHILSLPEECVPSPRACRLYLGGLTWEVESGGLAWEVESGGLT